MSTYTSLHYHIVFSTKHRKPQIDPFWQTDLHRYLAGTVKGLGGYPTEIGGVADHVHLLIGLTANHKISDFMRDLKSSASVWVHSQIGARDFVWQEGYAAFSVSAPSREEIRKYILGQEEHHKKFDYRSELLRMLQKAGVEYDPKYLD